MGRACVVADCHSRNSANNGIDSGSLKISHHEFPSEEVVRREWIEAVRRHVRGGPDCQATWLPSDLTTVCGLHFRDTDYIDQLGTSSANPRRRRLKPTAVPTVFNKPMPSQEASDLQVLANQALKVQCYRRNVDKCCTVDPLSLKNRRQLSELVPRYRRRRTDDDNAINDCDKSLTSSMDSTTALSVDGVHRFESMEETTDSDEESLVIMESKRETVQDENSRLRREAMDLKRKLSMARLSLKSLEKLAKVKELKKSRAMSRAYYYERMCSKLREELAAEKTRHEEQVLAHSLPLISDIEKQSAAGDVQAMFLMQQIRHFGKGDRARPQWEDAVLEKCASWLNKSHFSYRYVKRLGLVLLPSRSTLSRFADWKQTTVTTEDGEPSIPDRPNDPTNKAVSEDGVIAPSEPQQEQMPSVEMVDASGDRLAINDGKTRIVDIGSDSMDVLNRLADAAEVTIITLDPTTGVLELHVDTSTKTPPEVIEMTMVGESQPAT